MKKVIKIFNIIFMAIAATAIICLLTMPTMKIDVAYRLTPEQMAESFPSGDEEEETIDIRSVIGDEGIDLQLNLEVSPKLLFAAVSGDPNTVIEENFIEPNVAKIVPLLKKPIDLIGKELVKVVFRVYYAGVFQSEIEALKAEDETRTTDEIAKAGGLTDGYIDSLAEKTFKEMNKDNATVTKVNDVLFSCVLEGNAKFNNANTGIIIPEINESAKDDYKEVTKGLLDGVGMVKEDGESIYPVSVIMNAMLVDVFRAATEEQAPEGETIEEKANQLNNIIHDFVKKMIPAESYDAIATVLKILLVVILIFVATWTLFFLNTFFRTLLAKEKVWTFTGPIFWILGLIQIVLGVVLSSVISIMLSSKGLSTLAGGGEEMEAFFSGLKVSVQTCTFIPSILLLVMIPLLIAYAVQKHKYKKELKAAKKAAAIPPAEIKVIDQNGQVVEVEPTEK